MRLLTSCFGQAAMCTQSINSSILVRRRWFHTGDVGMWISGGRLKLIDRKKVERLHSLAENPCLLTVLALTHVRPLQAMFKLAQGEYAAPVSAHSTRLAYAQDPCNIWSLLGSDCFSTLSAGED